MSRGEFVGAVEKARAYIREGDIFQVNLSLRLSTPYSGNPTDLYSVLREMNPSPYMTLLNYNDLAVVGASPEQLLRVSERSIATRPIAGTRRRGRTAEEEAEKERDLLASEKERAEHLMMVDLERNDIGRVSKFGSVEVSEFMTLERYSHVVHIVSNVIGELSDQSDRFDALSALFPGGTITGAPKVRAMEIIDELEPVRRGIYTGAIGWIGYGPILELNIAIRSILLNNGSAWVQGGAGIVADSVGELEYRESLKKIAAGIAAVEEGKTRVT
jgi:anthranilate/para-aminobenzoate synthase component I